ncbi:glycosyl transferase family 1 [Candidatus Pacearchaeota archaeon CG10_big_fil_rev_8_21_14_0_10_32_14]|nr:MAG: glycosyl transferase family 1 [Candidatus Pacearchaeota archaeon CG10_big_fil_rev_8_21_14_0_10_32_14]
MKILLLYPYPVELDGQSLQGHYLAKGLRELGVEVMECDRADNLEKLHAYKSFKPDFVIGIGYWGDTPDVVLSPLKHGLHAVPWFNADGWVANYHNTFNELPLVVTTSRWVKETYKRDGMHANNIEPCSIGYDPSVFFPMEKNDPRVLKVRELLGIQPNEKMIFTAGGDVTSKGAQEMFRAIAKIQDKVPNWKYVLKVNESFSADNHGQEEEDLIESLGLDKNRITYLRGGYSPEFMGVLLNACDVYAAPSRLEGFGMIQLEAQASGKPVISINVGGPRDVIIHEKTGFLADVSYEVKLSKEWVYPWMGFEEKHMVSFPDPKTFAYRADVDQLADFTLRLLTDEELNKKMSLAASQHAKENFHYKVIAQRMLDLIKKNYNLM